MYKIESESVITQIRIPVSIPGVEADVLYQMFIYPDEGKMSFDYDNIGMENLYFIGLKVTDIRKFLDHQKSLGIDIEKLLDSQAKSIFTREEMQKIADGKSLLLIKK